MNCGANHIPKNDGYYADDLFYFGCVKNSFDLFSH